MILMVGIFFPATMVLSAEPPPGIGDFAWRQIIAIEQQKAQFTAAQRKLDSRLVFQLRQNRRQLPDVLTNLVSRIRLEKDGRVLVSIKAEVTDDLLAKIRQQGGTIVASTRRFHNVSAQLPLDSLENVADLPEVASIKKAIPPRLWTGSVLSQGYTTHAVAQARSMFGMDGTGIKVGVLSDSVDYLANSQASGNLPNDVTVLPGQSGVPGTGEGTAMLEIVNDLAPGAKLFFATADPDEATFAQNILNLRSNGCNVIVDDVQYPYEPPFQDGVVAQAVNEVTDDGALYFSSAGNGGRLDANTSATWEGDFKDGGNVSSSPFSTLGETGRFHNFATVGTNNYNVVKGLGSSDVFYIALFWSDPMGASTNDYDLFTLNPTGTRIYDYSAGPSLGTNDPVEICGVTNNCRVVAIKYSGVTRFLHLELFANGYGTLSNSTPGNVRGHNAAANAFAVAAVDVTEAYPNQFTSANTNEYFSSDGPRRIFYNVNGSPITPGNFTNTGGALRYKPDISAADGVADSVPGFNPFYGTSAAAPHAAAIAALLWSYNTNLTTAQIRTALTNTAIDIAVTGWDRDSGAGIVMPVPALQWIYALLQPNIKTFNLTNSTVKIAWNSVSNHTYQVQYTTNLAQPNWFNLGSTIAATNVTASTTDAKGELPKFYRVKLVY